MMKISVKQTPYSWAVVTIKTVDTVVTADIYKSEASRLISELRDVADSLCEQFEFEKDGE